MPNWCSNELKIRSKNTEMLKDFLSKFIVTNENGYEELCMDNLIPCPKELLNKNVPEEQDAEFEMECKRLVDKYGCADWYEWRLKHWGCKWDIGGCNVLNKTDNYFWAEFNTAWSPPIEFLENVRKDYPDLEFSMLFEEAGCNFCGIYQVTKDEENHTESELEFVDEDGKSLEYDEGSSKWKYTDSGAYIEDEDFYPLCQNPFYGEFDAV